MEYINAIVQGIVQGLTEFLPVSSSGHLSLVQHFTGIRGEEAVFLTVMLHVGTLLAVFVAFRELIGKLIVEFFRMLGDIFTGKFRWKTMNGERRMIIMLVIATLPLIFIYIFRDIFVSVASDDDILVEGICFLFTSVLLFFADRSTRGAKRPGNITAGDAVTVGIFQSVAVLPGVSRSGATISSAMLCGMTKETAVQFSFLLGIPPIVAGALVDAKELAEAGGGIEWVPTLIGMAVSAFVGFLAIKLLAWLIRSDKLKIFAVYTLVLGVLVIAAAVYEYQTGELLFSFAR